MTSSILPGLVPCSYLELPARFYTRVPPRALDHPRLLHVNSCMGARLGLRDDVLASADFLAFCTGQGGLGGTDPIATVYSGHQFGVWAGQLGDGRALLLGDLRETDGMRWEVQLKGIGRTPYSRMGDGWAVLRSSVREYLACEAMAGLGIASTRSLALVVSDDQVWRETLETAAVVARLAPSFVRFGHFEHWAHSHDDQKALLNYVVDHWFPDCRVGVGEQRDVPATAYRFLDDVVRRTARLIAQWQLVGFCHGVMNTDNMSVLGLTLDYGPYGFMDAFEAHHVCNQSDTLGRYAWDAQPAVAHWNLARLAESLQILDCTIPELEACLKAFEPEFLRAWHNGLVRKLGLTDWRPEDQALVDGWFGLLQSQRADFTLAFRRLADVDRDVSGWLSLFADADAARQWLARYERRLAAVPSEPSERRALMNRANPLYVLRNHLAQAAIDAAQQGDAREIERLLRLLHDPYTAHRDDGGYADPPSADMPRIAVSCSS